MPVRWARVATCPFLEKASASVDGKEFRLNFAELARRAALAYPPVGDVLCWRNCAILKPPVALANPALP